jgi:NADH-quinone oxidoreductase subunit N
VLAQLAAFAWETPAVDLHALAPELIVVGVLAIVLLVDAFAGEDARWLSSSLSGIGLLVAAIPVVTLAYDGVDRVMFGGGYVVDDFALVLKALFLVSGYVVILLSTNYVAEGDYREGEYYQLVLAAVIGMMFMASSRDLISMFVALETLSIPSYMLATWRKRDVKSNEGGLKYFLMGVFASAILLYGMSLLFGVTGSTVLADIGAQVDGAASSQPVVTLAIVFVIIGFAFKVSAVPFHTWAPDTYEGAPTPATAFFAVASKAAGFVALFQLVFVAFYGREDVYGPLMFVLAAVTMTVGNLIALRQSNVVRLLAYSGIAQAGYILAPFAIAGTTAAVGDQALQAMVVYLLIYAGMNLGAFAVVMAVARKTRSGDITSFGGLFNYAPGLTVAMTVFLFALAGVPPAAGWFGKVEIWRSLASAGTTPGYVLAVLVGVNSVIAFAYYGRILRTMWMDPVPDEDRTPIRVPASLTAALVITVGVTLAFGVYPDLITRFTESISLLAVGGG